MVNILHGRSVQRRGPPAPRVRIDTDCISWLLASGYSDIAATIDRIMKGWKKRKVKTRRDWWLMLAGTKDGKPRTVAGVELPILAACRERQGYPPCEEEIARAEHEALTPRPRAQQRWGKSWRRAMG